MINYIEATLASGTSEESEILSNFMLKMLESSVENVGTKVEVLLIVVKEEEGGVALVRSHYQGI